MTPEPYQREGFAVTIGDGVYVRNWPSYNSVILAELPVNKVVYVAGQIYVDEVAWHEVQYDETEWGYVRADMLRMMSNSEVAAYIEETSATPEPEVELVTIAPYNGSSLSSYGYVSASSVNMRAKASKSSELLRRLKQYAFCLVLGTEEVDGKVWYRISYDGQTGYVDGDYFTQMTLDEMQTFLTSAAYQTGISNNQTTSTTSGTAENTGSSSSSGIVSAEDQKVSTWVNPNSTANVSYEPFDPFATPEPLNEDTPGNTEYLDSLADQVIAGTLTAEDLDTRLKVFYKDSADAEKKIEEAKAYISERAGDLTTEAPTDTPEPSPEATEAVYPQDESSGGIGGWLIGAGVLIAGAGGGYIWYANRQRRRKMAQMAAQKRAAAQKKQQGSAGKPQQGSTASSAQNANRVRTGTAAQSSRPGTAPQNGRSGYSAGAGAGAASARTTGNKSGNGGYSGGMDNPYARYKSSGDEDSEYTASFRPDAKSGKTAEHRRRRSSSVNTNQDPDDWGTDGG